MCFGMSALDVKNRNTRQDLSSSKIEEPDSKSKPDKSPRGKRKPAAVATPDPVENKEEEKILHCYCQQTWVDGELMIE